MFNMFGRTGAGKFLCQSGGEINKLTVMSKKGRQFMEERKWGY